MFYRFHHSSFPFRHRSDALSVYFNDGLFRLYRKSPRANSIVSGIFGIGFVSYSRMNPTVVFSSSSSSSIAIP